MCLLMITSALSVVIAKAEDTDNGTTDANGGISSDTGFWYPTMGRFFYNQGTARGSYVHFTIDENTGTITDYTVKLTFYPMGWYGSFSSSKPLWNIDAIQIISHTKIKQYLTQYKSMIFNQQQPQMHLRIISYSKEKTHS